MSQHELDKLSHAFESRFGFPPSPDYRIDHRWATALMTQALKEENRFTGARFERIIQKIGVVRNFLQAQDGLPILKQVLEAVPSDRAMARFFMARVSTPDLLDVRSLQDVKAVAAEYPELDARGADVVGVYKIFVQSAAGEGSYTGLAACQSIAERLVDHEEAFTEARAADKEHKTTENHMLYNATTTDKYILVASTYYVACDLLARLFTVTTLKQWPTNDVHDLYHFCASWDDLIWCAEFDDLAGGFPGLGSLEQSCRLPRTFHGLNAQLPQRTKGEKEVAAAVLQRLDGSTEREESGARSHDRTRFRLGRLLLGEGIPATLGPGGDLRFDVFGTQLWSFWDELAYDGTGEGDARSSGQGDKGGALSSSPPRNGALRLVLRHQTSHSQGNGSPTTATLFASRLLETFTISSRLNNQ
ncbi:unnamed protein product [Jaminaea pallidilutea]